MIKTATPVFAQLAALADPTRSRMLLLLEQQPLSVGEVCSIIQLPQSTASRHLKVLLDEGWVSARAEGASRLDRIGRLSSAARRIWDTVRIEVAATAAGQQDEQRLRAVLEARRSRSTAFFSTAAEEWETLRTELFGSSASVLPLLGLLGRELVVGDLGCGTGQLGRILAPFVGQVIGVDASAPMLASARARAQDIANLVFREGQLESLPIADNELDAALMMLVLHYVVEPQEALAEAARAVRKDGQLLIVDMMPHDREDLRETMGHVWLGFAENQLKSWLSQVGFSDLQYIALPVDARAKGPALFAARATRS